MWFQSLPRWLAFVVCWIAVYSLQGYSAVSMAETMTRDNVKVMFMFQEVGAAGVQAVEHVLTRKFKGHGYSVLDHDMVAQTLHREADVLQLYEIEAAKLLGARLGATVVVSGKSQARSQEKTYSPDYSSTRESGPRKYLWRQDEPHVDRIPRPSYS